MTNLKGLLWLLLLPFAVTLLLTVGLGQMVRWKLNHHWVRFLNRLLDIR